MLISLKPWTNKLPPLGRWRRQCYYHASTAITLNRLAVAELVIAGPSRISTWLWFSTSPAEVWWPWSHQLNIRTFRGKWLDSLINTYLSLLHYNDYDSVLHRLSSSYRHINKALGTLRGKRFGWWVYAFTSASVRTFIPRYSILH